MGPPRQTTLLSLLGIGAVLLVELLGPRIPTPPNVLSLIRAAAALLTNRMRTVGLS